MNRVEDEGFLDATKAAVGFVLSLIIRPLYQPASIYLHSYFADRCNVFNEEWDLLIILDTCRPDALNQVSDEFPFIGEVDSRWSVGATSGEWVYNTFDEGHQNKISQTAYVTSNPYSRMVLENDYPTDNEGHARAHRRVKKYSIASPVLSDNLHTFADLSDSSEDYGSVKIPSPRSVTNHVIELDRSEDSPSRVIAHYLPPHTPYITRLVDDEIEFTDKPRSDYSFDAYIDNLRWALNEVSLLLENVDREKVVITADHGENFCLRPILQNHHPGMVTPAVRRVPWVQTTAVDKQTYEPELRKEDELESTSTEDTLEALGYLT